LLKSSTMSKDRHSIHSTTSLGLEKEPNLVGIMIAVV